LFLSNVRPDSPGRYIGSISLRETQHVTTVAFIGLGNMGRGMANRLLRAGHDVRVYNRTGSKAADLQRAGAKLCRTPREACTDAEAVFAMTADDVSSRAVWSGPDGVLAARLAARAFAIECSTLSYNWVMELASQARALNLRYVDAPVTGLPDAAAAGELTLLVGADTADLESARPILNAISNRILHFGAVGSGTAYKLIVNLLGAAQIASLAEGMALAGGSASIWTPSRTRSAAGRRRVRRSCATRTGSLPAITIATSCSLRSCDSRTPTTPCNWRKASACARPSARSPPRNCGG
jgi:3-hydroxyisobutyrate dehydrogenase